MKTNHAKLFTTLTLIALICLSARAQWSRWETSVGGNGHWYKAVPNTNNVTSRLAAAIAQAEGGYLATIASEEENAFVFNLVNSPTFFTALNGAGPLLGGRQQEGAPEPVDGWHWLTGEPWLYTNWSPESPNNAGPDGEDSLQFYSGSPSTPAATWNDLFIDNPNCGGYVVETDDDPNGPRLNIRISQVEICWQTASNRWYQLQYRSTLSTNQWLPLSTNWVTGDGTRSCATDAVIPGSPQKFYRLSFTNSPPP
jgi:hypothetical protein